MRTKNGNYPTVSCFEPALFQGHDKRMCVRTSISVSMVCMYVYQHVGQHGVFVCICTCMSVSTVYVGQHGVWKCTCLSVSTMCLYVYLHVGQHGVCGCTCLSVSTVCVDVYLHVGQHCLCVRVPACRSDLCVCMWTCMSLHKCTRKNPIDA